MKDFFLHYDETLSNDFVLENGARTVTLFKTDIADWRITFVDTGLNSSIGERLRRVRPFVEDEPMFLANYADVLTNAPLPDMIDRFAASDAVVSLLAVPPQSSHHAVDIDDDGVITGVTPMRDLRHWENGGYFVMRPSIFDELRRQRRSRRRRDHPARRAGPRHRVPVQGILDAGGHSEGTRAARGALRARRLPVDDLGSRAVG